MSDRITGDAMMGRAGPPIWNDPQCTGEDGFIVDESPAATTAVETAPPTLPAPGSSQPPDPAAARLEIEQAFTELHADIANWATLQRLVDDPSGLDVLREKAPPNIRRRILGIDVQISDLVFFSPIEASFPYRATIDGQEMSPTYGRARLVDGAWRITRTTVCQDLEIARNGLECTI